MEILNFLRDLQQRITEKLPFSIYLKRNQTEISSDANLKQLLTSQNFQLAPNFAWESITKNQAQQLFVLMSSNTLATNEQVYDVSIAENSWNLLHEYLSSNVQYFTNIAGVETFINGDSFSWHGIANTHFEAALAIVDDEKVLVFHTME